MMTKAKISAGLLLVLFFCQLADASLFPHTHFTDGHIITRVDLRDGHSRHGDGTDGENHPEPEPCRAQQVLMGLLSASVLSSGLYALDAVNAPQETSVFISLCEAFIQRAEACDNLLRGPPSIA